MNETNTETGNTDSSGVAPDMHTHTDAATLAADDEAIRLMEQSLHEPVGADAQDQQATDATPKTSRLAQMKDRGKRAAERVSSAVTPGVDMAATAADRVGGVYDQGVEAYDAYQPAIERGRQTWDDVESRIDNGAELSPKEKMAIGHVALTGLVETIAIARDIHQGRQEAAPVQ